jgi:hypothetical protein
MRSVCCAVVAACTLALGAYTTELYKDSLSTFAKGMVASQSALVQLDGRNNEIKRQQQLRAQKGLKIGNCQVGVGCDFSGLTPPKSTILATLLYMAQLVAYSNGLAELVAAKDTAAIEQAAGKIYSAAQSSIKLPDNSPTMKSAVRDLTNANVRISAEIKTTKQFQDAVEQAAEIVAIIQSAIKLATAVV